MGEDFRITKICCQICNMGGIARIISSDIRGGAHQMDFPTAFVLVDRGEPGDPHFECVTCRYASREALKSLAG